MKNFNWFENWYNKQTIKNFGNKFKISIVTTKNSGWHVKIDLSETKYANSNYKDSRRKSEHNYFSVKIEDSIFIGEGDFSKLNLIIGKFREFIGENKPRPNTKNDNFFSLEIQDFIFEGDEESRVFLHYTNNKDFVKNIIEDGFEFMHSFDKTTDEVKNNTVDLNYSHYIRKPYGDYVVIIHISRKLYEYYAEESSKISSKHIRVEEVLCEKKMYLNEDGDEIRTLSSKFIKGFVNYRTGEIIQNRNFNPNYDCELFAHRLKEFAE